MVNIKYLWLISFSIKNIKRERGGGGTDDLSSADGGTVHQNKNKNFPWTYKKLPWRESYIVVATQPNKHPNTCINYPCMSTH